MIDYDSIYGTLSKLDREYNLKQSDPDFQMPVLISKLAVLELCGWIEMSLDQVLNDYISKLSLNDDIKKKLDAIIKHNHGFSFDNNIFPLFCGVLGVKMVADLFDSMTDRDYQNLKTVTDNYSKHRNQAAHTDTPNGTTRTYDAPSLVIQAYNQIKPAVVKMEEFIQKLEAK